MARKSAWRLLQKGKEGERVEHMELKIVLLGEYASEIEPFIDAEEVAVDSAESVAFCVIYGNLHVSAGISEPLPCVIGDGYDGIVVW